MTIAAAAPAPPLAATARNQTHRAKVVGRNDASCDEHRIWLPAQLGLVLASVHVLPKE
jgi:hypothetical protein